MGETARRYLERLAEDYAFLFVGYYMGDPFLVDVTKKLARNWDTKPDFYKLEANPSDEDKHTAKEQNGITLVPYDKEGAGGHSQGIDAFFGVVCDKLNLEKPQILLKQQRIFWYILKFKNNFK